MNHGPTDFSTELMEERASRWGNRENWHRVRAKWAPLELEAYQRADGLIAPCSAALEAYFEFDLHMQHTFRQLPVYELPTGAPQLTAELSKQELSADLEISADSVVVGFFGRYHAHKGFDLFIETAKRAAAKGDRRFVFLSAGEGLIRPPKGLPNFVDLGWQDRSVSEYINYADLVLSPNRYNYFDLLILEAMSLGKPVVTSARGGHRCFDESAAGIVRLQDLSPESIYEHLWRLGDRENLRKMGMANRATYERVYGLESFAKRHSAFADYVLSDA
jgi:glycosyltransferase involved in cell wall biosynthesis